MTALISAELLRLRTVRSPRYVGLATVALAAVFAAAEVLQPGGSSEFSSAARADSLRGIALTGVMVVGVFAAQTAAMEFKRGAIALTYVCHPDRWKVTVARAITYAAAGGLLATLAAGVGVAVGLIGADPTASIDLAAVDVARVVGGALFSGAAFASLGVLIGTLTRNPTVATTAFVAPTLIEGALQLRAIHPYTPFGLAEQLLGASHEIVVPVAMILLLAYPAAVAVAVRVWALGRDVT
jgi:hypothetical protein